VALPEGCAVFGAVGFAAVAAGCGSGAGTCVFVEELLLEEEVFLVLVSDCGLAAAVAITVRDNSTNHAPKILMLARGKLIEAS